MPALLIATDLMAISAADGAAQRAGVELRSAKPSDAVDQARASQPTLIAIDLTASIGDVDALVGAFREACPAAKLLAFGPHVHEARLAAARAAGCDAVISRGEFHKRFEALLAETAAG